MTVVLQCWVYSSTQMLLRVKTLCLTVNSSTKLKRQVFLYAVKLHVISSLAAYPADILKAAKLRQWWGLCMV